MTVRRSIQQQRGQALGGANWVGQYGDPSVIPPNSAFGRSSAGVVVNQRSVASLQSVWACLRTIGDMIADLPVHVFRKTPIGVDDIEVEPPEVILDPYADITAYDGAFRSVTSLGLAGGILRQVIDRDETGAPSLIESLDPNQIKITRVKGLMTFQVGQVGPFLNPADVTYIPWFTLPGSVVGLNPIEFAASGFGAAIAAEDYASRWFAQGMHPSGILSVTKPLTVPDSQQLQQYLQTNHGGLAQSHGPLVLDGGAKWDQISVNPVTAQLLESRTYSKSEIASFYGVPLYFLADISDRGGTEVKGIEEMLLGFMLTALKGYSKRLDLADTALLPPGYYAHRDVNDVVKTNAQMMSLYLAALRNSSIATPNELRHMVNLPPSTEPMADSLFAPLNSNATPDWAPNVLNGEPVAPQAMPTPQTGTGSSASVPAATPDDDETDLT